MKHEGAPISLCGLKNIFTAHPPPSISGIVTFQREPFTAPHQSQPKKGQKSVVAEEGAPRCSIYMLKLSSQDYTTACTEAGTWTRLSIKQWSQESRTWDFEDRWGCNKGLWEQVCSKRRNKKEVFTLSLPVERRDNSVSQRELRLLIVIINGLIQWPTHSK